MKFHFFILFTFLFWHCKNVEHTIDSNCKCYKGIGSDENSIPDYQFSFENNQKVTICGFVQKDTISEFTIFDCANGNSLIEYDATQNCKIEFKNNELNIYELDYFPSGKNWKWEVQIIALQKINQLNKRLIVNKQVSLNLSHEISIEKQILFLDSFKTKKYTEFDTEELIGRLEILALTNNIEAVKILLNLQDDANIILDGAIKEQYNNAIAKIKWMKI